MSAGDVDDREAAHRETDPVRAVDALVVWSAVRERACHPHEQLAIDRASRVAIDDPRDAAHRCRLSCEAMRSSLLDVLVDPITRAPLELRDADRADGKIDRG